MPNKHSLKVYSSNTYYHIYNRGVEKRLIFQDAQDYAVYLSYLKTYLLPKDKEKLSLALTNPSINYKERGEILKELRLNNFYGEISLIAYCLMPNHFHLLVKQNTANSIDKFMNSLGVRYTMFFNKKYKRIGPLYQDVYKAVVVETDEQLAHLTRYIHLNPLNKRNTKIASKGDVFRVRFSQPSSYPEYLGERETKWIHTEDVLNLFSKNIPNLSYQAFIEQKEKEDLEPIQDIVLDL